jgi:hypothetical protein
MPRDGTQTYILPFPDVVADTTIESPVYNGFTNDVAQDLNLPRPIVAGGTGATNADQALFNMAAEKATQVVTNYDSHVWVPGSFRSAAAATGAPNATAIFSGVCYIHEALANPPTNQNVTVEARDMTDGRLYVRRKTAGVWGAWVTTDGTVDNTIINGDFRVNQGGYVSGAVLAAGLYGHDQWKAGAAGGNYSFTQLKSSTQITIASGKTLIQPIEDANVTGGSYVLSWLGTAQARAGVNTLTPSGAYAASPLLITGQTAGTVMSVEFNTGTLDKVKLEPGLAASPFVMRPYDQELVTCQRYFQTGEVGQIVGGVVNATTIFADVMFTVKMRSSPAFVSPTTNTFYVTGMGNPFAGSTATANSISASGAELQFGGFSGLSGNGGVCLWRGGTGPSLTFDARL